MKRYIEVSKHVSGRMITQRYPAREVACVPEGTPIGDWAVSSWDEACKCGYIRCLQTGPCAPQPRSSPHYSPIAPEPPADVLPEGWHRQKAVYHRRESYVHDSNAEAWRDGDGPWYWTTACETECAHERAKPTRDAAMAAALASVQPEPALRAGWAIRGTFMGEPDHWFGDLNVCSSDGADGWSVCNERGHELSQHPTLEAAMLRAEALARGEL